MSQGSLYLGSRAAVTVEEISKLQIKRVAQVSRVGVGERGWSVWGMISESFRLQVDWKHSFPRGEPACQKWRNKDSEWCDWGGSIPRLLTSRGISWMALRSSMKGSPAERMCWWTVHKGNRGQRHSSSRIWWPCRRCRMKKRWSTQKSGGPLWNQTMALRSSSKPWKRLESSSLFGRRNSV